jgi:hypothetical protein
MLMTVFLSFFLFRLEEIKAFRYPDNRCIPACVNRKVGDPLVQPTTDHDEEGCSLKGLELPGRHVEGRRGGSRRKDHFHLDVLVQEVPQEVS